MILIEREIDIPLYNGKGSPLAYFEREIQNHFGENEIPIRFAISDSKGKECHCELGVLTDIEDFTFKQPQSIFNFSKRKCENSDKFNAVLLVPTGIGAEIGGHAGDAGPVARLLASACDTLITHPNVVNASDINELPENGLYVEGSVISNLLMGTVGLQKVRSNRVLLVMDKHPDSRISDFTINATSAARAALGIDCPQIIEMNPGIKMRVNYSTSGSAVGCVEGLERLCEILQEHRQNYDAVALTSVIDVPVDFHMKYFKSQGEMVNPWGGVEAMLTHAVALLLGVPTAHSPMMESMDVLNLNVGVVDPRMSAESISTSFLHSVLKGLHRSPRIISDWTAFGHSGVLTAPDVSCLVIPDGCVGLPTLAALEQGIPVIAVRENKNMMKNSLEDYPFQSGKLFIVDNYLEAVGVMNALKAGVSVESIRRPLASTRCVRSSDQNKQVQEKVTEESPKVVRLHNK